MRHKITVSLYCYKVHSLYFQVMTKMLYYQLGATKATMNWANMFLLQAV